MSAPTNKEKYEIIKEHLELNLKEKGNVVGINEMRKHISAYTKNMPEASRFRDEINHITDVNILMIFSIKNSKINMKKRERKI